MWRTALVAWAVVFAVLTGRLLIAEPGRQSVYPIYALAAHHWQDGADLYPTEVQPSGYPLYRYSPTVAAALVPLGLCPHPLGEILWRLLTGGLFLIGLLWWCRAVLPITPLQTESLPDKTRKASECGVLLLLVLPLVASNWNNGQSNLLVLGLLLIATTAVARCRWNLAAACLALACLFKVYPLALALLLCVIHPRQLTARLLIALVVGLALSFCLQDPEYVARQYVLWYRYLTLEDRSTWPVEFSSVDFRLLVRVWIGPLSAEAYHVIQLATAVAAALVCLAGRRAGWSEGKLLMTVLGLGCVWMTAFGPASEGPTYVLLAPVAAWAVLKVRPCSPGLEQGLIVGAYLLLLSAQLAGWVPGLSRPYCKLGVQPFAALLLLGGLQRESRLRLRGVREAASGSLME